MRWNSILLYSAVLIFAASGTAIMVAITGNSRILVLGGILGIVVAAVFAIVAIWLPRRKVDWRRIEAEQRLWESGPMGRKWLRVRRKMYKRWQL